MELIDNIHKTFAEDLRSTLTKGSCMSVAASCFSIYAYQELRKELEHIEELRFIFTSPTFIADKTGKEQREFYIPRLSRESRIASIPATRPMPSMGSPTLVSTRVSMISPPPGTPAVSMEASVAVTTIPT